MSFDDEQLQAFHHQLLRAISRAFWHPKSVHECIVETLPGRNRRAKWPKQLVDRLFNSLGRHPAPSNSQVKAFLETDPGLKSDLGRLKVLPRHSPPIISDRFRPHPALEFADLPRIISNNELASCLQVSPTVLTAFSNVRRPRSIVDRKHEHYHYRWLAKRYGTYRLIEAPKERLKTIQSRILKLILDRIPAHRSATAFMQGRSIRDAVAAHVGQDALLRVDLKDFFPSIGIGKIRRLFRCLGYPVDVAGSLASLCTNVAPVSVFSALPDSGRLESQQLIMMYELPHLPQGAPTSPALSNLVAYRLDARLAGLAASYGVSYSRYADDLMFSGGCRFATALKHFQPIVLSILLEEGYLIRRRKTRVMRRGRRQTSLGLTLNDKINTRRDDYQALKATLFNCIRLGTISQNRENNIRFREHLLGKIAFHAAINSLRGEKLRALFNRIDWTNSELRED